MSILSKTLYIFLLVFTFMGLSNVVFAQTTLPPTAPPPTTTTSACQEVPLPNLPGIEDPCSSPAAYIQYWFYFSLYLAGIVALLAFVVGGTLYMFSGASSSTASTGKKWMVNAILGLILLFGSWLLLRALGGPGLTILQNPVLPKLPPIGEVGTTPSGSDGSSCSTNISTGTSIGCPSGFSCVLTGAPGGIIGAPGECFDGTLGDRCTFSSSDPKGSCQGGLECKGTPRTCQTP